MRRRRLLASTGVVTALLVLSAAAYACTVFKGDMTVTGTSSSTGTGNNSGMGYCNNVTPAKAGVTRGTSFSARVATSTSCAASLPNGTYDVNWIAGTSSSDCMTTFLHLGGEKKIGSMSVSAGSGSGSYTIPTSASVGDAQVCVSDSGANNGMQMPVTLA